MDDLTILLPVFSSGTLSEGDRNRPDAMLGHVAPSADDPLYALEYPLVGTRNKQRVEIFQNGVKLKSIDVTEAKPSTSKRLLDKAASKLGGAEPPSDDRSAIALIEHHAHERVDVSLLGFYPLDDTYMVMRVFVEVPPALRDHTWKWTFYGEETAEDIPGPKTIHHSVADDGTSRFIVSVMMRRDIKKGMFLAYESSNTVFPGYLGIGEQFRDENLFAFYDLTTDVKANRDYAAWFVAHRSTQMQLAQQRETVFESAPKFSIIIPVYEPPLEFVDPCIRSVFAQTYENWELVLVNASPGNAEGSSYLRRLAALDGTRVKVVELEGNRGIAGNTNAGLAQATGDYLCFVDQDDVLEPDILFEYAREIDAHPETDLIYCDEDSFEGDLTNVYGAMLKPDWDEDFMYGHNFVVHMLCVSRAAFDQIEPSPDHLSGAQDYDLTLKVADVARRIAHIPRVLYHWREHENSTNSGKLSVKPYAEKAGRDTLAEHFERRGISATVEITETPAVYRCLFDVPAGDPAVELFLIAEGTDDENARCRTSIDERNTYGNLTVTQVASREEANRAALTSSAEYVMFMDSGIEPLQDGFVEVLLGYFQRENVGSVGSLIMFEDGPIFHAGMALMTDGNVGYMNRYHTLATNKGYLGSTECTRAYSALTSRCVMFRKEAFAQAGGYDGALIGGHEELDLGWKLEKAGYLNVYTPHVRFVYHLGENLDGREATDMCRALGEGSKPTREETLARMRSLGIMHARWPEYLAFGDPHINPNCSKSNPYYALGW